ncbi:MAG: hypothetical protein HY751_04725 [Nitrospinae bacterium]|nr:hypothetical protein [Nitrospinota bacterium]
MENMEFIDNGLARIRGDREKGAAQLALTGVEFLRDAFEYFIRRDIGTALANTRETALALSGVRPAMAPIANLAAEYYRIIRELVVGHGERPGVTMAQWAAARVAEDAAERMAKIATLGGSLVSSSAPVMTISYSSTVENILLESGGGAPVIIAEGRPLFEGRKLALSARSAGAEVTLITDAQMGVFIEKAGMALIGADTLLPDMGAVNKVGSYQLALLARERGVKFMVAADTYKINATDDGLGLDMESNQPEEVWELHPEICANVYFESVPPELITGYITEEGVLGALEMKKRAGALKKNIESLKAEG